MFLVFRNQANVKMIQSDAAWGNGLQVFELLVSRMYDWLLDFIALHPTSTYFNQTANIHPHHHPPTYFAAHFTTHLASYLDTNFVTCPKASHGGATTTISATSSYSVSWNRMGNLCLEVFVPCCH